MMSSDLSESYFMPKFLLVVIQSCEGSHIECGMTVRDLVFGTSRKRWLSLSQCSGRFWERRRHLLLLCASCLSSTAYGPLLCPQTLPNDVLTLSLYVWTSPRVFVAGFFYLLHVRHQAGTSQGIHNCSLLKWCLIFLHSIVPLFWFELCWFICCLSGLLLLPGIPCFCCVQSIQMSKPVDGSAGKYFLRAYQDVTVIMEELCRLQVFLDIRSIFFHEQ